MKKITGFILLVLVVAFVFPQEGLCREKRNLYYYLTDKDEVKTYLQGVTDSSGDAKKMRKAIKKNLENALVTRMTINFKIVSKPKDADIIINCNVIERIWLEVDPIDQIGGISSAAMDALIEENYGRLQAEFEVINVKRKNKVVWDERVQATITKKIMPEKESIPLLEERIVKIFMKRCFSKNSKPTLIRF